MPRDRKRMYAKFERATWRNKTFRDVLSDDARWMWMYLLTTPRTMKCPGLIDASVVMIAEDLGWDRRGVDGPADIVQGIKRTTDALEELAATVRKQDGLAWIKYSNEDRLVFVPRAISHNLPSNSNIVSRWAKDLDEYPDCQLKKDWVELASSTLKQAFGNDDHRFMILRKIHYQSVQQSIPYPTTNSNPFDGQPDKTIEESQTVTPANGKPFDPQTTNGCTNGSVTMNMSMRMNSKNKRGGAASREKPLRPPDDFSKRQKAFFVALVETEFYVRAKGIMKAVDVVKDPVRLARNLGAPDTYPLVDVGLIGRLGAWSLVNTTKAKVDIAKFILNRARATQERGGPREFNGGRGSGAAAIYGDLESKSRK